MDKLDRINFYQAMHSNLVKWWTFNMVDPGDLIEESDEEDREALFDGERDMSDYDADAMAEELLADALGADADTAFPLHDGGFGFGEGVPDAENAFSEEAGLDPEAAAAAMEIFNRLQAEAAADEAAKQAEIEAAKAVAASNFG